MNDPVKLFMKTFLFVLLIGGLILPACGAKPTPDESATRTAIAGTAFALALTTLPGAATPETPPPPAESAVPAASPPPTAMSMPNIAWVTQVIDEGEVGLYPYLLIGPGDIPHIAYLDEENDNMKYATVKNGAWSLLPFESPNVDGFHPAIVLDGAGNPTICRSVLNQKLISCTYFRDNKWAVLPFVNDVNPRDISLDMDSQGALHMVIYDENVSDIKYIRMSGGSWQIQSLAMADQWAESYPFLLGANDQPHLSYSKLEDGLMYATNVGGAWGGMKVDTGGAFISLALDPAGLPHISYYDSGNKVLKHAVFNGSTWDIQVVDNNGDVGKYTSMAIDANGNIHISYYDQTNASLKYALGFGGQWITGIIDRSEPGGDLGLYTSLALDSAGNVHIAYYDKGYKRLKYAVGQVQ